MDTWMGHNSDPVTLHKYLYANADPANGTDPSGNFTLASIGAAQNVASVLMDMQIQTGFSLLDGALSIIPGGEETQAQVRNAQMLMGIVQLGAGGVQILRMLSGKFRKLCNSFDGDTLVHTANGLKKIKNIKIGEMVWAYDEDSGESSLQRVIHLVQSEGEKQIVDVTLDSGEVIQATANHPFFIADTEEPWVDAVDLNQSMWLLSLDGDKIGLSALASHSENKSVFNLSVAEDHTFFVSERGVLVHNTTACEPWRMLWGKRNQKLFIDNLKNAGKNPPAGMVNPRAHHIIQIGAKRFEKLQEKLATAGISGNSAHNGVWLPNEFHKGLHTDAYYRYLERQLDGVNDKAGIIFVLDEVASELANGVKNF